MYKKLFFIISLITSLAIIIGLIGLRIFAEADRVSESQVRALVTLKSAESLYAHATRLEMLAIELSDMQDPDKLAEFRREYGQAVRDVNDQVAVLHKGDCKGCHEAILGLEPELKSLQKSLLLADRHRLSSGSEKDLYTQKAMDSMDRLKQATVKIHDASARELKNVSAEIKDLSPKALNEKRGIIEARIERDRNLLERTESTISYLNLLREGIRNGNAPKAQTALAQLPGLVKFEPQAPRLEGDCYECHYTIASLPQQMKEISKEFMATQEQQVNGSLDGLRASEFKQSIKEFEQSSQRILSLARADALRSAEESRQVRKQLKAFMLSMEMTVVIVLLASAFFIVRWVRKRLLSFSDAIEAISEGNYSYIVNAGSNDEIADLAHAFNLMVSRVRSSQEALNKLNQELRELHFNTVKAFVEAIEAKDPYTRGHSENVARYSLLIAQEIGLSIDETEELHVAALLHDIGKIGVHEDILNKPAPLNEEEYKRIIAHPIISAQIVGSIPNLAHIATIIRYHHEHFDGKGYVEGLSGESIPLGSRILAVADSFDAMTSDRPYRSGWTKERALEELKRSSGTQFDPMLVEALIRAMEYADDSSVEEAYQEGGLHGFDAKAI